MTAVGRKTPFAYLNLAEAVAAVCPPHEVEAVRRTIAEALGDGRLVEEQRSLMSAQEAADLVSAGRAAGDAELARQYVDRLTSPPPISPKAWRQLFKDGRVDWSSGRVRFYARERVEEPVFAADTIKALLGPDNGATRKGVGGRPFAADWGPLEVKLEDEIRSVGFPSKLQPYGWRGTMDVVRWLAAHSDAEDDPKPGTLKERAKAMLQRIRAKLDAEKVAGN